MSVLNDGAAADDSDRQRCSCLPFGCLWGADYRSGGRRPNKSGAAPQAKRRRRRRLRLSSWLAWPWFRKRSANRDDDGEGRDDAISSEKGKKRRRGGRRLLLLLTTSLQPKKALASVVSRDSSALLPLPVPVPAKVSSYGDAKKQSNRRQPRRPTVHDDAASGSEQPQASSAAATDASTGSPTAPARSRPEMTRATDGPASSGRRNWRAPSSRRQRHSLRQPGDCARGGGLWTAASTLGVIVFFGRVTAVVFLCSCLYGARFVRAWAAGGDGGAGASAKGQLRSGGVDDGVRSSSRRFGDPVVVAEMCATEEECKKKVIMAGLLDRAGRTPSSRFGR